MQALKLALQSFLILWRIFSQDTGEEQTNKTQNCIYSSDMQVEG